MQARKSYLYLIYTHFGDERSTDDESCKGDHYHVLVTGNFESKSGNIVKASQTYVYEQLNKWMKQKQRPKASCKSVKSMLGYVDYLKNFPRILMAYSPEFINLAESGYFHPTQEQHARNVDSYALGVKLTKQQKREESLEPPPKFIKMSHPDKTFMQIKNYLEMSGAVNVKQLVRWAAKKQLSKEIKDHICVELFRRKDFDQLVDKALAANRIERTADNWKERLECATPKKHSMSIKDSITLIKKWHEHNNLKIETDGLEPYTPTQMFDEILSKKITKKKHHHPARKL